MGASNTWNGLISSFHVLGKWLEWRIKNGLSDKLGLDTWIGGGNCFIFSQELRFQFSEKGLYMIRYSSVIDDLFQGRQNWISMEFIGLNEQFSTK